MTHKHSHSPVRFGWIGVALLMLVALLLWSLSAVADVSAAGCSPVAGTLITNPSFEDGSNNWSFYTNGNGGVSLTQNEYDCDSAVALDLVSSGSNVQFYQNGISLDANTTYTLTFAAYSTTGADFDVELLKHSSPFTNYGLQQTVDVGNNWQLHTIQFTTSGFSGSVDNARFRFRFHGVNDSIFYIDAVNLVAGTPSPTPTPNPTTDPVVNSLNDPGDGVCDAAECTLREAVAASSDGSVITFEPGLSGTIVFNEGEIEIDGVFSYEGLTIQGPGIDVIALSGAGQSPSDDGFFYAYDYWDGAYLTISDLTMKDNTGDAVQAAFGGIHVLRSRIENVWSAGYAYYGAGVAFTETEISNTGSGIGAGENGFLRLNSSTITGIDYTQGESEAGNPAVWIDDGGYFFMENSTISGNEGGGVYGELDAFIRLESSTITDNGIYGLSTGNGGTYVQNSIIADQGNGGVDCIEAYAKYDDEAGLNPFVITHSLDSDGTCFVEQPVDPSNIQSVDPKLMPLGDNGGPTLTHAIRLSSPAFDSGECDDLTVDQRGKPRPKGAACDMGAFERRP